MLKIKKLESLYSSNNMLLMEPPYKIVRDKNKNKILSIQSEIEDINTFEIIKKLNGKDLNKEEKEILLKNLFLLIKKPDIKERDVVTVRRPLFYSTFMKLMFKVNKDFLYYYFSKNIFDFIFTISFLKIPEPIKMFNKTFYKGISLTSEQLLSLIIKIKDNTLEYSKMNSSLLFYLLRDPFFFNITINKINKNTLIEGIEELVFKRQYKVKEDYSQKISSLILFFDYSSLDIKDNNIFLNTHDQYLFTKENKDILTKKANYLNYEIHFSLEGNQIKKEFNTKTNCFLKFIDLCEKISVSHTILSVLNEKKKNLNKKYYNALNNHKNFKIDYIFKIIENEESIENKKKLSKEDMEYLELNYGS